MYFHISHIPEFDEQVHSYLRSIVLSPYSSSFHAKFLLFLIETLVLQYFNIGKWSRSLEPQKFSHSLKFCVIFFFQPGD